ncbi:unnamed protein product [Rhizophagus irregularis]|nr:unnamed protein product [Rhizophagus irregularis]
MKEIDKAMKGRFQYKDTELKWVLQQLHRHRRENWRINLDPEKAKSEKKRKGINSRRGDKKERHQKGLIHMFNAKDNLLSKLKPSSLSWDEFNDDCELLMNEGEFHSNEVSETDDELAQEEVNMDIRPKNKKTTDKHVLHVYDKPWRSGRVRELLRLSDSVGEKISHVKVFRCHWYEDKKWCDNSKPPEDAPEWTISRSYDNNDDHQSMIGSGEKENIENE